MPNINEQMMLAFQDEMEKQAISLSGLGGLARRGGRYLANQATTAGGGMALGGAAGAGIGTAAGGVSGYRQARQEGATRGQALMSGLSGGLGGASKGVMIGAGVGGVAGMAGGARARGLIRGLSGRETGALGKVSRFGERQMHSLTGALPEGMTREQAMRHMRMGSHAKKQMLDQAEAAFKPYESFHTSRLDKAGLKAKKNLEGAQKAMESQEWLERQGATSLPGYIKSMAKDPRETLRHAAREGWYGSGGGMMGAAGKALTIGFPAYGVGKALVGPEEENGMTRGQRIGQALGGAAFGLTGAVPLLGQSILIGGMTKGLESAGKGVDVLRGKRGKKKLTENFQAGRFNIDEGGPELSLPPQAAQALGTRGLA